MHDRGPFVLSTMEYQSLASREYEAHNDSEPSSSSSPSPLSPSSHHPPHPLLSPPLEIEAEDRGSDTEDKEVSPSHHLESMLQSMISAGARYEMVEDDDYETSEYDHESQQRQSPTRSVRDNAATLETPPSTHESVQIPNPFPRPIPIRTVSREGTMRHPTPALQSLQGACIGNVERLERSAERLSMSSDIGEQLRKIQAEQKRSESRKSSLARKEGSVPMPAIPRKFSASSNASNSIIGMNSAARSGGFSPSTYMTSPIGSLRSPTWTQHSIRERSTSHGERFMTQISEPEREGRPLDSPISVRSIPVIKAPRLSTHDSQITDCETVSPTTHETPDPGEITSHNPEFHHEEPLDYLDRPLTAASTDTHRQATNLFADFDGVHITPHRDFSQESQPSLESQASLTQYPLVDGLQPHPEHPTGENMVYYPAPVPIMLNLPEKLSRLPPSNQRDKRKSQMIDTLNANARKSAAWLPDVLEGDDAEPPPNGASKPNKVDARRSIANLPPQLRASIFFEHQSLHQDVEIKGGSAVATLDSILDASAFAPVNAFTDHPIVGHVGSEIYGRTSLGKEGTELPGLQAANRKSQSSLNLLKKRHSSGTLLKTDKDSRYSTLSFSNPIKRRDSSAPQLTPNNSRDEAEAAEQREESERLGVPRDDDVGSGHSDESDAFLDAKEDFDVYDQGANAEEDEYADTFDGPPTTLLAELQLRKKQQKQRNRTAATAFPQGMHSTLLQLDAVAQVEKQSRQQKHIKLAWEDPTVQHPGKENEDDEDIPLGMLYPRGSTTARILGQLDDDRPLGLIAKRALEDTEPLSQRRARLRGDPLPPKPGLHQPVSSYSLNVSGLRSPPSSKEGRLGDEGETLGQRLRKLKQAPEANHPIIGDFASEVMSQFGGLPKTEAPSPEKDEDSEETLGQRRKRLQAERHAKHQQGSEDTTNENANNSNVTRPPIKHRRSLADILQAHPIKPDRTLSQETLPQAPKRGSVGGNIAVGGLLHQYESMKAQNHQRLGDETKVGALNSFTSAPSAKRKSSHIDPKALSASHSIGPGVPVFNYAGNTNYNVVYGGTPPDMQRNTIPLPHPDMPMGATGYQGMIPNASTLILPMVQSGAPLDSKHRNMIDRWRQSVQY